MELRHMRMSARLTGTPVGSIVGRSHSDVASGVFGRFRRYLDSSMKKRRGKVVDLKKKKE